MGILDSPPVCRVYDHVYEEYSGSEQDSCVLSQTERVKNWLQVGLNETTGVA